ncbi:MAG: flippase [Acidobacteriota bacterium]
MRQPLFARGITLLVNNAVGQGLAFLISIVIARRLGAPSFGEYAAVMALIFVLGIAAEVGLEASLTREIAQEPFRGRELLVASLRAKAIVAGALAVLLGATPVAVLLAPDPRSVDAVRLGGVLLVLNVVNSSFSAVFRAWGRMHYVLAINLAGLTIQLAGVIVLLLRTRSVAALIGWLAAVQVGELVGGVALFRRGERTIGGASPAPTAWPARLRDGNRGAMALLRRSLPLALAGVLGAFRLRLDLFLVEALRGSAEVGVFSVGTRLQAVLALAPSSFFAALFPAFSATAAPEAVADGEIGSRLYRCSLRAMAVAGCVAAVTGLVLAGPLVGLTFGSAYAGAAPVLRLLALAVIPFLLNSTVSLRLYAGRGQSLANRLAAFGLAIRATLGWLLVARWGASGAALTELVAEGAVLLVSWHRGVMNGGFAPHDRRARAR